MSDTVVSRRWVLGGVAVSTTQLCTAAAASTLAYQAVKRGLGGDATKSAAPVGDKGDALQRLALSGPLHHGEMGNVRVTGFTPGSTVQIVTNSLELSSTAGGITIDRATETIGGTPTRRSYLLRETLGTTSRNTLIAAPESAVPTMKVGMNLAEVNFYSRNDLFIDFLKCGGWADNNAVLDADGLPVTLSNGRSDYLWPIESGRATPIKYRLITDGDMDVSVYGIVVQNAPAGTQTLSNTVLTREGGDYVFTYAGDAVPNVNFYLSITAIRRKPTRMAMVRDDEAALFAEGEIFRPGAVADLSRFACLRDLNLAHPVAASTNVQNSETYISYYVTPLTILAKLAIKTGVPLWHQLNYLITDDAFQAALPILADLKSRGLLKAVEVGNEVWNEGTFGEQYAHARAQGLANPAFTLGNQYYAATWWAGYRSAQLGKIAREAGYPLPFVIGPQPVQPGLWYVTQAGRNAVPGGLKSDCPLYMSTAYCSGIINLGVTGAMGAALDAWVAGHDIDALLDNALNYARSAPDWGQYTTSIVEMAGLLAQAKANADAEGMELVCYEAHGHFNAQPYARNIDTYKLVFVEMYKSELMRIAARQILETAQAAGVKLLNWFDWNSAPTRFENGYFGTRGLPAYDVLTDWQARLASGGNVAPPAVSGFRYFRINPSRNLDGRDANNVRSGFRLGIAEATFFNGATAIDKSGMTASTAVVDGGDGASTAGNVASRLVDGSVAGSFITEGFEPGRKGTPVIDVGARIEPTLMSLHICVEAKELSFGGGIIEASNDKKTWTTLAIVGAKGIGDYVDGELPILLGGYPA